MLYTPIYDEFNIIESIRMVSDTGTLSIPLCKDNTDFCRFLVWNKRNEYPIEISGDITEGVDMDLLERIYGDDV